MERNNVSSIKNCFGCGVCAASCHSKAITLRLNVEGFYEPHVIEDKCIKCGLCYEVCSFVNKDDNKKQKAALGYASYSLNPQIRQLAASGGVGYEIGCWGINNGYTYCGVKYDIERNIAKHFMTDNVGQLLDSCGSKYIQSFTVEVFSHFERKRKYIVVGTPCQIASLRRYINRFHLENNFILVDFFCHGVPSYWLWQKYLKHCNVSNIESIVWRNKDYGWHDSWNMIIKNKGKTFQCRATEGDLFYKYFLGHYCLGKQCVDSCRFKMFNSCADIRIGDFWGKAYQNNEEGVSAVITFTERGDELLKQSNCKVVEHPLDVVVDGQMENNACNNRQSVLFCKLLRTSMPLYIIDKIIMIQYYYTRLKDKLFKCKK